MKIKILKMLRETDGYVSGQELCNQFGVSRTAIWKAVSLLKEAGYEIEATQSRGYHFVSAPDVINEVELGSLRNTEWLGRQIHYFRSIDSTNTKAKVLAEGGSPHGTLVVADQQVAGKGRRGRSWESSEGDAISMTFLLKPDIDPNNASMLTLVTALAVTAAITDVTSLPVKIKWPNDIVINGKKVCGILTEMSAQFDYINHIVVGIGINVNNTDFPEKIAHMATSLFLEGNGNYRRAEIIERTLEYFEKYYAVFLETQDLEGLVKEYNFLLVNLRNEVKVLDPKEPFEGRAMGITKRGELIVDTWESRKLVSSGEVSVRGIYGYV